MDHILEKYKRLFENRGLQFSFCTDHFSLNIKGKLALHLLVEYNPLYMNVLFGSRNISKHLRKIILNLYEEVANDLSIPFLLVTVVQRENQIYKDFGFSDINYAFVDEMMELIPRKAGYFKELSVNRLSPLKEEVSVIKKAAASIEDLFPTATFKKHYQFTDKTGTGIALEFYGFGSPFYLFYYFLEDQRMIASKENGLESDLFSPQDDIVGLLVGMVREIEQKRTLRNPLNATRTYYDQYMKNISLMLGKGATNSIYADIIQHYTEGEIEEKAALALKSRMAKPYHDGFSPDILIYLPLVGRYFIWTDDTKRLLSFSKAQKEEVYNVFKQAAVERFDVRVDKMLNVFTKNKE